MQLTRYTHLIYAYQSYRTTTDVETVHVLSSEVTEATAAIVAGNVQYYIGFNICRIPRCYYTDLALGA